MASYGAVCSPSVLSKLPSSRDGMLCLRSTNLRYAAFVALLGSALAGAVFAAVDCDLDWRYDIKKKIEAIDTRLFPEKGGAVSGRKIIYGIALGFLLVDVALLAFTFFTRLEWFGLHR